MKYLLIVIGGFVLAGILGGLLVPVLVYFDLRLSSWAFWPVMLLCIAAVWYVSTRWLTA